MAQVKCAFVGAVNELLVPIGLGTVDIIADRRGSNWRLSCLQVLTKDSVTVSVDAVVYYRVSNATISIANVENAHHSTRLLAQTTLRNTLGMRPLHEILSDRDTISSSMQITLDEATDSWGIKVERVEMWVLLCVVSGFRRDVDERPALFWYITQRRVVTLYRRLGTTYQSHLQGSRNHLFLDPWKWDW